MRQRRGEEPGGEAVHVKNKKTGGQSLRGIVHAARGMDKFSLVRFEPGAKLAPFVEHYWSVRYDLPPGETYVQTVLSFPNVHLAFEEDEDGRRALIYGIPKRPFVRLLRGSGRVLGVKFRAGGFYPFWKKDVSRLTGTTVPAAQLFGPEADRRLRRVLDAGDAAAMAGEAEDALVAVLPDRDGQAELADRIVRHAMDDRSMIRVEQLAERSGMSVRGLQRLFRKYVGVSPKWVIKRFRLQEAAERIERGAPVSWADLAMQLGYFDQAHFIRDFKSVLGMSPAVYKKGPDAR